MSKSGPDTSYPFCIEIHAEDKKIISLDTDEMEIEIYQKQNGKSVRIFEISCKEKDPEDCSRCLETTAEFVGDKDDEVINMEMKSGKMTVTSEEEGEYIR